MTKAACPNLSVDLDGVIDKIKAEVKRELRKEFAVRIPKSDLRQIAEKTNSVVVPRDQACPVGLSEQEVPFNELTPTLQNFVRETGMDAPVKQCARMGGLGQIKLIPSEFKGTQFALGLLTIPNVLNFATRLAEAGVVFPKMNRAAANGVLAGGTLVTHVLTGGNSFTLGALVGQFPSLFDALAVEVIEAMAGPAPAVAHGHRTALGQTAEEQELLKLRAELQNLSAVDSAEGSVELENEGLSGRRHAMVVN